MRPDHFKLMYDFVSWAGEQSHIAGIALVGPCADDENEEAGELTFLLLSDKKSKTIDAILHQFHFEEMEQVSKEDRGSLVTIRISYASGLEVEFGVADEAWLQVPIEQAAGDAFMQGFKVIWEREALFEEIGRYIERRLLE